MVQADRQTPLSPLHYHYNLVEFSRVYTIRVRGRSDEELPPTFTLEVIRACKMGSGAR